MLLLDYQIPVGSKDEDFPSEKEQNLNIKLVFCISGPLLEVIWVILGALSALPLRTRGLCRGSGVVIFRSEFCSENSHTHALWRKPRHTSHRPTNDSELVRDEHALLVEQISGSQRRRIYSKCVRRSVNCKSQAVTVSYPMMEILPLCPEYSREIILMEKS